MLTSNEQGVLGLYSGQLKNLAKEDYLAARSLYLSFNLRPARVMAHQPLEKMLKSICLANGIEITAEGHDIHKLFTEKAQPLGVLLPTECEHFIKLLGQDYNDVRYEMKPTAYSRSEVWVVDKCFFGLLRYSHWYRPNGVLSRGWQPLEREFGDLLKSDRVEDQQKKLLLTAETIIGGNTVDQLKHEFKEFQAGNNTFWDSHPNDHEQIFSVLNKFIKGFGLLVKNPSSYDSARAVKIQIDPAYGQYGETNQPFAPLSFNSSGGEPAYAPPEWETYYDKVEYVD